MRSQILATFPAAILHAFYAWEGQVRVPRRALQRCSHIPVSKSGQTQCRVCRAPHTVRCDVFCRPMPTYVSAQLGGLGAFALPASRLAPLTQQLRADARFVRAIKSLPPPTAAPISAPSAAPAGAGVSRLPTMAASTSIFDPPAVPFAATMQPSGVRVTVHSDRPP